MKIRALFTAWALLLAGCSTDRQPGELFGPSEEGLLVVDAILLVDRPTPTIRLSRAVSPDRPPGPAEGVIRASVSLHVGDREIPYTGLAAIPGDYVPHNYFHRVLPDTVYRLEVRTAEGETLRATTRTPSRFSVESWVLLDETDLTVRCELLPFDGGTNDSAVFDTNRLVYTDGLLEGRFLRPDVPAFQVGLFSLDEGSDYVIDPEFFEPEDFEQLERLNSSPALEGADGTVRLPWFAIFFEGRYMIKVHALDANWYDLIRSDSELSGGGPGFGGNAGDSFERPIFRVDGGIGLFGSAAVDSIGVRILPLP
jgi:hypothetical protein